MAGGEPKDRGPLVVTIVTLVAAVAVFGAVIYGGPYRGTGSLLVQVGLLVAIPGGGLVLRRLGLGEPIIRRPGWRWLGAGALLYIGGVPLAINVLAGLGCFEPCLWEDLILEVLSLAVIVSTPLALGPEMAGDRR